MRAYLEVKFLDQNSLEIVSVGFVTQDGHEYYAELARDLQDESVDVGAEGSPVLSGANQFASLGDLMFDMVRFCKTYEAVGELVFAYEGEDCRPALAKAAVEAGIEPFRFEQLQLRDVNNLVRSVYYRQHGLVENHALNDALALKAAVE